MSKQPTRKFGAEYAADCQAAAKGVRERAGESPEYSERSPPRAGFLFPQDTWKDQGQGDVDRRTALLRFASRSLNEDTRPQIHPVLPNIRCGASGRGCGAAFISFSFRVFPRQEGGVTTSSRGSQAVVNTRGF
jgi:hypothetical protein